MPLLACCLLEFVTQPTSQSELMHYYQFNIGDYASHTRHLTLMEDLIYRRLLDWYYLNEKPIPLDSIKASRLIQTKDHFQDVETILIEFFIQTDDGWINKRADNEIAVYQGFIEAGKRGAAKRWAKGGDSPPISPPNQGPIANTKQEPLTTNHEQLKEKKRASPFAPPSISEVQQYITDNSLTISANGFIDYYESNGWMVGKNKMKNWQATCRTWEKRNEANRPNNQTDTRSRAKKFSDKLDEIARKSVEENGFTERVG